MKEICWSGIQPGDIAETTSRYFVFPEQGKTYRYLVLKHFQNTTDFAGTRITFVRHLVEAVDLSEQSKCPLERSAWVDTQPPETYIIRDGERHKLVVDESDRQHLAAFKAAQKAAEEAKFASVVERKSMIEDKFQKLVKRINTGVFDDTADPIDDYQVLLDMQRLDNMAASTYMIKWVKIYGMRAATLLVAKADRKSS